MNRPLALLTAFAFLSGCQTFAPSEPDGTPPVQEADQTTQLEPSEYGSFSQETLFALLTAELAGQRNRFDIALGNYVQMCIRDRPCTAAGCSIAASPRVPMPFAIAWACCTST